MCGKSIRLAALAVLMVAAAALGQPPAGGGKSPEPKKEPKTTALEESLAQALANNPDVRVAEAKVREAEAELNRARMQVMQKVVAQRAAIEARRAELALAEAEFRRFQELRRTNAIAGEELTKTEATLQQAKAALAQAEAELNALLGRVPGDKSEVDPAARRGLEWILRQQNANARFQGLGVLVPDRQEPLTELGVAALLAAGGSARVVPLPEAVRPEMAQRVRKFLNAKVKFERTVETTRIKDLLEFLQERAGVDVPVLIENQAAEKHANVHLPIKGELTVAAVVQALEDVQPELVLAVRDYGILVTVRDKMPAKAVRLLDFWRSDRPPAEAPPAGN